jgi:hypothetical protein
MLSLVPDQYKDLGYQTCHWLEVPNKPKRARTAGTAAADARKTLVAAAAAGAGPSAGAVGALGATSLPSLDPRSPRPAQASPAARDGAGPAGAGLLPRSPPMSPQPAVSAVSFGEVVSVCAASAHCRMHASCALEWLWDQAVRQGTAKCPVCRLTVPIAVDLVRRVQQTIPALDRLRAIMADHGVSISVPEPGRGN